jgi:carboxylate-amine ligase
MSSEDTGITLGVEEEYLLLDAAGGLPVPSAAKVQRAAGLEAAGRDDCAVDRELLQAQVEVATPVCRDLDEVTAHLIRLRALVGRAAGRVGCLAAATGAAPLGTDVDVPVTPRPRYQAMRVEAGQLVDEQLICGMHVHVSVPDRDAGAGALARLRPWLPVLIALGANSPFWNARDTGFASWRTVVFGRWPASGAPPFTADGDAYEQRARELLATGVIPDRRQLYWHARLSDTYPTLEVRAPDVQIDAGTAVTLAGLVRGLVATALDEVAEGRPAPDPPAGVLTAAGWHAARHGLADTLVDPRAGKAVGAAQAAQALLDHVTPALRRLGDEHRVGEGLRRLLDGGTGADRQRAAARSGGDAALVDLLTLDAGDGADARVAGDGVGAGDAEGADRTEPAGATGATRVEDPAGR